VSHPHEAGSPTGGGATALRHPVVIEFPAGLTHRPASLWDRTRPTEAKMPDLFREEIQAQLLRASEAFTDATRNGDDFLADAFASRLAQLARVAADHGITS